MGRTACAFFWTDILPFISKIYHLPVTSWQSEPDPVLSHTRPSRRTTLMKIKGHLQTDGIRILMWLFQFLSLIHTVVMKFVFEFLCLTCPLISSPSHSSPGQTLSHMPHAVFALSTGHFWRHLLVCQGFMAGSKACQMQPVWRRNCSALCDYSCSDSCPAPSPYWIFQKHMGNKPTGKQQRKRQCWKERTKQKLQEKTAKLEYIKNKRVRRTLDK